MAPSPTSEHAALHTLSGEAQRLQLLIDSVTDYAIYMLEPSGHVATWNSGAQKLKGYGTDEIVGQHFSRFFTAEDQAAGLPAKLLVQARETGHAESEGWRVRKDGVRFWASAVLHAMRDPAGKIIGFAKVTRDITERMATQQERLESERRFRLLVEGVIDYAIYMLDPSGIVTNWNAGAQRLKGYSAGEIVGQHFSRFYTPEDRAAGMPLRILDQAIREGRFEAEGWRLRKDGSRFWASVVIDAIRDESGTLVGLAKITRDLTERRATQEVLRESERQFRLLVGGVTDYALYMLDPNGIVTNWNAGAERIKGYMADEIVGQHFSRFYTDDDRAAGLPARALHTALSVGRFEAEGWRVRKDGSLFWANVIIDPIRESGRLAGFAKITRDITEKREADRKLQEAQTQRAYAQKMEALGQFTGGVAHDFNNMLMIVSGHSQMLRKRLADDPKAARNLEAIDLACRQAESLTRQLLSFSRRQPLNPSTVRVGAHIDGIRAMMGSTLGAGVRLVTDIPAEVWPVRIDVNEFELAVVNLAINARDAMPQGGMVTITAVNVQAPADDAAQRPAGDFVALSVADNGSGIAEDILPRVFEPFFTTKHRTKGSGLGLAQVHGFAHQSGGTVTLRSKLGEGTTVTMLLPRASAGEESPDSSAADPEGSHKGIVLLVEDNPEVAAVTAELLAQLGYRVEIAGDAVRALDAIQRRNFDLVVSDVVMAGPMDGLGLARSLRQRNPELPILLVTGFTQTNERIADEFAVIRKPFRLADLSRAITAVMGGGSVPDNLLRFDPTKRQPK